MRSGKSYFNMALFKKTVTRWWPIWGTYLVIWFFILPFSMFVDHSLYLYNGNITDTLRGYIWFAALYSPICAMAVLSHLYWPRSANFYGTLPVKRQGIFLTQYTAGLCFTLVPNLIIFLLTSLLYVSYGSFNAGCMFGWLAVTTAETFFFYTFAILCGLFAGHVLALPVFYGVFNCVALLFSLLLNEVFREAYYGFAGFPEWVEEVIMWLTPGARFLRAGWGSVYVVIPERGDPLKFVFSEYGIWTLAVYSAVAVIMLAASYGLYKFRRTESAGDVVAVARLRPVFKYGVAVCSGFFLGYVTDAAVGGLPIWIVIWTVVGCFAAQMILDKSFRVFKKWHGALVAGLVVAAAMLVVTLDLTGFEKRVPELEDVESIEVNSFYARSDDHGASDSADWGDFTLTDRDDIEKFIDLHRALANNELGRYSGGSTGYMSINMTYHTSHGAITRAYSTSVYSEAKDEEGTVPWALERIFSDRELYWHIYGFDELETFMQGGGVPDMSYSFNCYAYGYDLSDSDEPELEYDYFKNGGNDVDITRYADIKAVFDALKEDFFAGRLGVRTLSGSGYMSTGPAGGYAVTEIRPPEVVDPKTDVSRSIHITIGPSNVHEAYVEYRRSIYINVTPTAEKTLSVIHSILPRIMEEQGLLNYEGEYYDK